MGDLSSVAYREAGNAVVAASYKIPIAEIWINEDGSGGSAPSRSYTHLEPVDQFAVLFGGYAAQKHFDTWAEDPIGGPSYLKITNTLLSMTEAERLSLVNMGRDRATDIIVANRLEVQRLVTYLIERRSIHMDEFGPRLASAVEQNRGTAPRTETTLS
jgi:hypothetical protein